MTPDDWGELLAVVAIANDTDKLAFGLLVPVDPQFQ
jgi:hypothetical protein